MHLPTLLLRNWISQTDNEFHEEGIWLLSNEANENPHIEYNLVLDSCNLKMKSNQQFYKKRFDRKKKITIEIFSVYGLRNIYYNLGIFINWIQESMHREPRRQSIATYEQYNNIQHDIWRHTKRLVSLRTSTLPSTPSSTHISSLSVLRSFCWTDNNILYRIDSMLGI